LSVLNRAKRNISFKGVGEFSSRLMAVIFYIYITRKLGNVEFGKYSFAYSFCGLFSIILNLGLHALLIRNVARDRHETEKYVGNITSIKLILSLITFFLINILIRLLGYPPKMVKTVELMAFVIIGTGFLEYFVAVFGSWEIMEYEAVLKIFNKIAVCGLGAGILVLGYSLNHLVGMMGLGYLLSLILGLYFISARITSIKLLFDVKFWWFLFRSALPLALTTIFTIIYLRIDIVMLSLMHVNNAEIGWYSAGVKIIDTLGAIPFMIMGGIFPIFSDLFKSDPEALKVTYEKAILILIILGIPIAFGVAAISEQFVYLIYGQQFAPTVTVLRVLIWVIIFAFVNSVCSSLLVAIDMEKINLLSAGCCVPINIGLNLLLIPKYGYIGAGLATVITSFSSFLLCLYFVSQNFHKLPLFRMVPKPMLSGFLMGGIIFYLKNHNIIILIILGVLIYISFLYILKTFSKEDRNVILRLIRLKSIQ